MKRSRELRVCAVLAWVLGVAGLAAPVAQAESGLVLGALSPAPALEGRVYGAQHAPVGANRIDLQAQAQGRWTFEQEVQVGGQERQAMRATLARDSASGQLRLLSQEGVTRGADGRIHTRMWIDHVERRARCRDGQSVDREIALPEADRVANNALPLVMRRLVESGADELRFQFLLCRPQLRLVEVAARVESRGEQLRIRCDYDLGPLLTPIARALVPNFRYWFEPAPDARWLGHQLLLERGEPVALVVRQDIDPRSLEQTSAAR